MNYAAWRLRNTQVTAGMVALLSQQDQDPHPQAETIAGQLLERELYERVVLLSLSAADPVLKVW
jgi:hypothetical protein